MLPALCLVAVVLAGGAVWLNYASARPATAQYLVTPEKYAQLSTRASQITNETWSNRDGSQSRGWLLRGTEGNPAVILLHKYGADRSYMLNLGVKLNESTNFTIMMPDLRGHGEQPPVENTSFGGCEAEDTEAAIAYLRSLKNENDIAIVGPSIGIYGIEMGAIAALKAASTDPTVKALVLDSVPYGSDGVLYNAVAQKYPFGSTASSRLAGVGSYMYYFDGCYVRDSSCDVARKLDGRRVLLLSGIDTPDLQTSTGKLTKCFPGGTSVDSKLDLSPAGFRILNASMEQSETYDRRVIDFFAAQLAN
jgi:pimeloyl-ACP methyl ester carboxylesterase